MSRLAHRLLLRLVAVSLLVVVSGCREPAGDATSLDLGAALADHSPTFALRHTAGAHPVEQAGHAIELSLDNCDGDTMRTYLYDELGPPAADGLVAIDELPAELAAFRGVMAALVREKYRLAQSYPPALADHLEIPIAAHRRQGVRVHASETWDENLVEVRIDDGTVAEIPVRVLLRVDWTLEMGTATVCDGGALDAQDTVPLVLAMGRSLEVTTPAPPPEPTAAPEICEAPLPDSPAQELVTLYVQHLGARDHASAYALLAESYQLRLPYPQYSMGYEPVRHIALCSLETVAGSGGRETLFATLRITLEAQGAASDEPWVAQYTVQTAAAGGAPGAIASVSMYRAALHK